MAENSIQSVTRTFKLLEFLIERSGEARSLKEISAACALPPPTAYRLLGTLCALGYVAREEAGRYRVSYKLFELAGRSLPRSSLISVAKPFVDEMSGSLGESAHLMVRDGLDAVYVYKATQPLGPIQMSSRVGMRIPLYRCASGKAIMATLSDGEIADIFSASDIAPATPNTVTDLSELMRQIEAVRMSRYAFDNEENEQSISCVAVSLGGEGGGARYACSVSTLTTRLTPEHTQRIIAALLKTKREIEPLLPPE